MSARNGSKRSPDPRPARTRAAILSAIERLGADGADLSIAAIVAEAQLSRSSFYSQFKDLGDVAVQLVRELYVDLRQKDAELRERGSAEEAARSSTAMLIHEFYKRRNLYAAVLSGGATASAQWTVCEIMAEGAFQSIGPNVPEGTDPEFAAKYIAAGVLASLIDWINGEVEYTEAELLDQIVRMLPDWVVTSPAETP